MKLKPLLPACLDKADRGNGLAIVLWVLFPEFSSGVKGFKTSLSLLNNRTIQTIILNNSNKPAMHAIDVKFLHSKLTKMMAFEKLGVDIIHSSSA